MGRTDLFLDVSASPTILWFRLDLRLADNAALAAALARGGAVIPVYILDDQGEGRWQPGGASRWWLHHSLAALEAALRKRGSRLILRRGESGVVLKTLARETGAGAVYWNRRYEPAGIERDATVEAELAVAGVEAKSFNSALLFEPQSIANKQGRAFQVFTPFWRHCLTRPVPDEIAVPGGRFPAPRRWPRSFVFGELGLRSAVSWDARLREAWLPGEAGALKRLRGFLARHLSDYDQRREVPGMVGTSLLSPHLHFGEIGPRQIWAAVRELSHESGVFPASRGAMRFLTEVGWREFARWSDVDGWAQAVVAHPLREPAGQWLGVLAWLAERDHVVRQALSREAGVIDDLLVQEPHGFRALLGDYRIFPDADLVMELPPAVLP